MTLVLDFIAAWRATPTPRDIVPCVWFPCLFRCPGTHGSARLANGALKLERANKFAARLGVSATPYLLHVRGTIVREFSGAMDRSALENWLDAGGES